METAMTEKIEQASNVLLNKFKANQPCICAYSGGKDSGAVAILALNAAKEAAIAGLNPFLIVTTSSTLVENPEIDAHIQGEHNKMRSFAQKHNIKIITKIVTPNLSSTWQVKVLTGRGLPSYAGTNSDCTVDLKITPQRTYRRSLYKMLKTEGYGEPVICLGTRFDESSQRAANMESRGESALHPVMNTDGELVLSPIAYWETEDVWELIGMAANAMIDSYSDFAETKRIYAHSEGTSCAVVADAISTGKKKGGCGARTGCHVCLKAEDKSLENLINYDPRYAYAKGLNKLNKFLRATRFDWSRRHWIGRTIKAGYIAIQPDVLSPAMCRDLLRYMLQLDFDEQNRADAAGVTPMFNLLPLDMMVAVDAIWSLNGFAAPFTVWADYDAIYHQGERYDIPEIVPVAETPLPDARYIHVGAEWDDNTSDMTGMRDGYFEALTEGSPCNPDLRETKDGRVVWDLDTESSFTVNAESAYMIQDFELESLLEKHHTGYMPGSIGAGYKFYIQYGAINLSHSQLMEHDNILRRTAFKDRLGFTYNYAIADLLDKSVEFDAMPYEAQAEWMHKAPAAAKKTQTKKTPAVVTPVADVGVQEELVW